MTNQDKRLYESQKIWDQDLQEGQKNLARAIADFFPADVKSMLDVGCGDGKLTSAVMQATRCDVTGLDSSQEALSRCAFTTLQGDAASLPFEDGAFDLVMSADMLEHLPDPVEDQVWKELFRVSRSWVIAAVPFREELLDATAKCSGCANLYHVNWHMRSYDWPELVARCPSSHVVDKIILSGEPWSSSPTLETKFRRIKNDEWSGWSEAFCPHCGQPGDAPMPVAPLSTDAAAEIGVRVYAERLGAPEFRTHSEILVLYRPKDLPSLPEPDYTKAELVDVKANEIVFVDSPIESNLVAYPALARAVRAADQEGVIVQFPAFFPAEFLEINSKQGFESFEIILEDGAGEVLRKKCNFLSEGCYTFPLPRKTTTSYYGILLRLPSISFLKSVRLGKDYLTHILRNADSQQVAYHRVLLNQIPIYTQVLTTCLFNKQSLAPRDISLMTLEKSTTAGQVQLVSIVNAPKNPQNIKHVLMLCHDQNLDRRVVAQAASLRQFGHRVTIFCLSHTSEDAEEYLPAGIHVVRIGLKNIIPSNPFYRNYVRFQSQINRIYNFLFREIHLLAPIWRLAFRISSRINTIGYRAFLVLAYANRNMADPLPFTKAFFTAASDYKADIIQVHDLPTLEAGSALAKPAGLPLVYDAHELYPEQRSFSWIQKRICSRKEKKLVRFCDQIFAVNDSIAEEMAKRYAITRPATLLNAIDPPAQFNPNDKYDLLREKLVLSSDIRILLFQGGFSPHRNLENLIMAMSKVKSPSLVLVMMGFGAFGEKLEKKARKLGLLNTRIYFLPAVSQSELLQHTASADAGIIPYPHVDLNSYYCTPNKLFEFIQAGLPIIANDSPELRRFVQQNAFGLIQPMHTASQIADAIDAFFGCSNIANHYRQCLQNRRGDFTWQVEASHYLAAMAPLLNKSNEPAHINSPEQVC